MRGSQPKSAIGRTGGAAKAALSPLAKYIFPRLGRLDIGLIDYRLLHDALEPLCRRLPDTGSLVRARIEAILDFAAVKGARSGGPESGRPRSPQNGLAEEDRAVQAFRRPVARSSPALYQRIAAEDASVFKAWHG